MQALLQLHYNVDHLQLQLKDTLIHHAFKLSTHHPLPQPITQPTNQPTNQPTKQPTLQPTHPPAHQPPIFPSHSINTLIINPYTTYQDNNRNKALITTHKTKKVILSSVIPINRQLITIKLKFTAPTIY